MSASLKGLWPIVFAACLIVAATVAAYSNSFTGVFVLDEQTAIIDNPHIRSLSTAFSAPKDVGFAGRPIVSLSFALNYALAPAGSREAFTPPPPGYPPEAAQLFYANVWGYHAVNLAIHAGSALLLFGIVRRTLLSPRLAPRFGSSALLLSTVVALLWAVHPLTTGSITYVAQRVESLMGFFFLLTLYCAIRAWYAERSRPAWSAAAVAACMLGAGTKEVIVSAPLLVVLYDLVFLAPAPSDGQAGGTPAAPRWNAVSALLPGADARAVMRRRWPLYAGLFATWLLLAALVLANPRPGSVGFGVKGWSSLAYLRTQAGVIAHYLRLAFWPSPLVLDYDWPAAPSLAAVWPQALLLVVLLGLTAWAVLKRSPLGFAGAWFFLILAPSSSILPIATEIAAEHRMYLPLCAVVAVAVVGGFALLARLSGGETAPAQGFRTVGRGVTPPPVGQTSTPTGVAQTSTAFPVAQTSRFAVIALAALLVPLMSYLTYQRNEDYQSDERIWADTVAKRPDNGRAHTDYGAALFGLQRFDDADRELRTAIRLRPGDAEAHLNLGAVLASQGKLQEGIEEFRRAIALAPGYRDAYRNLGEALATIGRDGEAVAALREAMRTAPDDARLLDRMAWILATSPDAAVRDGATAVRMAERAVQATQASDPNSLDTLAAAYAEVDRFADAVATEERAIAQAAARGMEGLMQDMQARLAMYRSGQKFRQAPPAVAG